MQSKFKGEAQVNVRRTQWLLTGVGMVILAAMEVYLPSAAETSDTKIVVKDFTFKPTPVTVKAGATVTWTNMDDEPHTVVSDTGVFKSGGMDTNESFSFKFDKPGTYHFTCSIHPRMVGTIVVQ
jgi:plastocyanin